MYVILPCLYTQYTYYVVTDIVRGSIGYYHYYFYYISNTIVCVLPYVVYVMLSCQYTYYDVTDVVIMVITTHTHTMT